MNSIPQLSDWFHVRCTDTHLELDVRPPNGKSWRAQLAWGEIVRVCVEIGDMFTPDDLYIFVREREASYVVPLECDGHDALVENLIARNLVVASDLIDAMTGKLDFKCWPEE